MTHDPVLRFLNAYAAALADIAGATTGRIRRGARGTTLAISGAPVATMNGIISPDRQPSAAEIDALAASEAPWDLPWSIHVRGVPAPDVAEVATRNGLTESERLVLMIRDPAQGMPARAPVRSVRIRPVPVDEFDLYARTVADGFEAPHETLRVLANPALAGVDGMTCYLAELDGAPVGTGMTVRFDGVTGIYNISTVPAHRRRGYGRIVTAELVRAGFADGAPTAYLCASEANAPFYEPVGFHAVDGLTVMTAPS